MLTISQLARFVGVTVRAVRHYHARGLLPEPARDASGYRRYGYQAVIDLIRIKTLADAGVPLSRVRELLQADPEQFARAVDVIDDQLQGKIRALEAHREAVRRLAPGDGLGLPEDVAAYLTRLRALGLSERTIGLERDGWILLSTQVPDRVSDWIEQKQDFLEDPQYRNLYVDFDRAFDWQPDDPRLRDLARAMLAYLPEFDAEAQDLTTTAEDDAPDLDSTLIALVESEAVKSSPAWQRLTQLLSEITRRLEAQVEAEPVERLRPHPS